MRTFRSSFYAACKKAVAIFAFARSVANFRSMDCAGRQIMKLLIAYTASTRWREISQMVKLWLQRGRKTERIVRDG